MREQHAHGPNDGLLLRSADEEHALAPAGGLEPGEVLMHHVVLALAPGEVDPWHALDLGEAVHCDSERVRDLRQWRGRGDRQTQLLVDVGDLSSKPADRRRATLVL